MMSLVDLFLHEYHLPIETILHDLPLAAAFGLVDQIIARKSEGQSNAFVERQIDAAMTNMRRALEAHYDIAPPTPRPNRMLRL